MLVLECGLQQPAVQCQLFANDLRQPPTPRGDLLPSCPATVAARSPHASGDATRSPSHDLNDQLIAKEATVPPTVPPWPSTPEVSPHSPPLPNPPLILLQTVIGSDAQGGTAASAAVAPHGGRRRWGRGAGGGAGEQRFPLRLNACLDVRPTHHQLLGFAMSSGIGSCPTPNLLLPRRVQAARSTQPWRQAAAARRTFAAHASQTRGVRSPLQLVLLQRCSPCR